MRRATIPAAALEKYSSSLAYGRAKLSRGALRTLIRPMCSWRPLGQPEDGYTLIIATFAPLAGVLPANFKLLARQDLSHLREVIVSMDDAPSPALKKVEAAIRDALPVPTRVLYRSASQARILHMINWGWVNCWLNYVEALAACRTRYALLHDMDAMLIDAQFLARRYARISGEAAPKYLAIRWYEGNGITAEDRVGYVVDIALDVAWLRQRHRPIDAFNHVARLNGRRIEWDTLLYPQHLDRSTAIMPVEDGQWVHPSQVASQYMYLRRSGSYRPNRPCTLPWIPYLLDLSGVPDVLDTHRRALAGSATTAIPFLGGTLDLTGHLREQTQWTAKQMFRLEEAMFGEVRPIVRQYVEALSRHETP